MPTITINIAAAGTARDKSTPSAAGHMWFDLNDGKGTEESSKSFGWGPDESKPFAVRADVIDNDSATYKDKSYSRTINISQAQYESIYAFADNPGAHGFTSDYNAVTHSCIDYVWRALAAGGLNPGNYEGRIWPPSNAERIASIPDVYADHWSDAAAEAFVNELFQHSQDLATELWKARLLTVTADGNRIDRSVANNWNASKNWRPVRSDPLILDLDGDGIETSGVASILFDHDGDGTKTATGWVNADDGFLVFDRNGNGSIDNGAELFGDATALYAGGLAADGFAALTQEDSNTDGKVDRLDGNWHRLRVWRDLNQDGVSQAAELLTMAQTGIASIAVAKTEHSQVLANGNQLADLGTYVRTDGAGGALGEVSQLADIDLAEDTFHREFTDPLPLADGVAALPDMRGAGRVRDLRQAASLSPALQTLLTQYSQATTRHVQLALLDPLLSAWADTTDMAGSMEQRVNGAYVIEYRAFGNEVRPRVDSSGATIVDSDWSDIAAAWNKRLQILAAFNGNYFFDLPLVAGASVSGAFALSWDNAVPGLSQLNIHFSSAQIMLLNRSYDALRQSVYGALIMQTRFKLVMNKVELVVDANGIRVDYAQVKQHFEHAIGQNAADGLADLIEFNRHVGGIAGGAWNGIDLLEAHLRSPVAPAVLPSLHDALGVTVLLQPATPNICGGEGDDIVVAGSAADCIYGMHGNDIIFGGDGRDRLYGEQGNDVLIGGAGDDVLVGDAGDDTLEGGAGNDSLEGGAGNDIYRFGRGDGADTLYESDATAGNVDIIVFKAGVTPDDVLVRRSSYDLMLTINGTDDALRVGHYFGTNNGIEQIQFVDGTVWDAARVRQLVMVPTDDNDEIWGEAGDDILSGGAGNDRIDGAGGNDVVHGDAGNDWLSGGEGNDTLHGGAGSDRLCGEQGNDVLVGAAGDDTLIGDAGDDTLDGGAGNDMLYGGTGNDIYRFGRGDGADRLYESDATAGNVDIIVFKAGVTPDDIVVRRSYYDLILTINGTDDALRIGNYFGANGGIEQMQFVDGTVWDTDRVRQLAVAPTDDNDGIEGEAGDDILSGGAGNDRIDGFGGNDVVHGDAGNDWLYGGGGNDMLHGGAGSDRLCGEQGNDLLVGGAGDDALVGNAGDDTLDGGAGSDSLEGGSGNDIYRFGRGDGADTIYEYDATADNVDIILLKAGVTPDDLLARRSGYDLMLTINGTDDVLRVDNYFGNNAATGSGIEQIRFADGMVWDAARVRQLVMMPTDDNDEIEGETGNDNLSGGAGNDRIDGSDGNDVVYGDAGNDWLYGGVGNDTLHGGAGSDRLRGEQGNDVLVGGVGNDALVGDAGDDTLDGGAGNDMLDGGSGNDTYRFGRGDGADTLYESDTTAGNIDIIVFKEGVMPDDVMARRRNYDLMLTISGTDDALRVCDYFGINTVAGNGIEQMQFADGTIWDAHVVQDKLSTAAVLASVVKQGTPADEILLGEAGNDKLYGDAGDDTLDGGGGNDTLNGGSGNDTYLFGVGSGQDTISSYDDTAGKCDVIQLGAGLVAADIVLARQDDTLRLSVAGATDSLHVSHYFNSDATRGYQIEEIRFADGTIWDVAAVKKMVIQGTDDDDVLYGYTGDDTMQGLAGDDTIRGRAGNDVIDGGAGADRLYGEAGDDTLYGGGQDDVLYGDTGADLLQGQAGDDKLYGGTGDDTLDGGAGNDTLDGGRGNDTYLFGIGSGKDTISSYDKTTGKRDVIQLGAGIDATDIVLSRQENSLRLSITGRSDSLRVSNYFDRDASTGARVEEIRFADDTIWDVATVRQLVTRGTNGDDVLHGYASDDLITGGAGDDRLYGEAGDDTLSGGSQDDVLSGDDGADLLQGQAGDDQLYGGAGDDTLDGGAGDDTLDGGSGNDTYLFGIGSGKDTISSYDGSAGKRDVIALGEGLVAADIVLRRQKSALQLSIAGRSDTLRVTDFFNDDTRGYQIEEIRFADGTSWDVAAVRQLVARATEGDDVLYGDAGADTLHGLAGDDKIWGKDGNDVIDGGSGTDFLYGEAGDDTLSGGSQDDVLYGEDGADLLQGQAGDDQLYGGAGDDTLDGGAGNDTLDGGSGNDTYLFGIGSGKDTISYYGNTAGKRDVIQLGAGLVAADIVLARCDNALRLSIAGRSDNLRVLHYFEHDASSDDGVEEIRFADGTIWDGATVRQLVTRGTNGDDVLYGYAGADSLHGLSGDDTIRGNGGNDVIDGGTGADLLYGDAGDDSLSGGDQNDILQGGDGADLLQGQAGDDRLYGNSGNDMLDGGAGNDELQGESGNDMFIGGAGNDVIATGSGHDLIVFNRGDGQDSIASISKNNTLSLGNGIAYADLLFTRNAHHLTLVTGANEQITFRDWYRDVSNHSIATLQMFIEDGADYDAASANALNNKKIMQFNFDGLVSAFDQARAENVSLTHWAVSSALAPHHLGASDVAAIGGELAYQYARKGSLSSLSLTPAQGILADAQFGLASQNLLAAGARQDASSRLM